MTTKKVVRKKAAPKTVFEKLEDSVIAVPFKFANKTFLASLGLFSVVQKELLKNIDKYAKDGEKVRDDIQSSFKGFRKEIKKEVEDVVEEAKEVTETVRETLKKAA